MPHECRLSIITVNYNGLNDTCVLIETIPFNDTMEMIVVDNASNNDEASIIQKKYPHVHVIRSEQNLGFAGGNNLGIKAARGRHLFFINNDTIFKDFNIQALTDRLDSSDTIAMVCPKIRFAWGNNPIQFAGYTPLSPITIRNSAIGCGEEDHGQYDSPHPTPYAHGAAMLIKREAIEKVGLMPDEELDWSMMMTRAGYEIWYEPACTIYHKESQTTGQDSPLRTYYITRNRLLLVKRNIVGLNKYLAYFYLMIVVASRDTLKYAIKRKNRHFQAVFRAIKDFCNSQFSILTSQF